MNTKSRATYPIAVHVLLTRGDDILFLRRANTGYADGQWSVPAGHVEAGESASVAAARECAEEVGVHVRPMDLHFVLGQHKRDPVDGEERLDIFFRAVTYLGEPKNCEPHKCSELKWARLEQRENVVQYVKNALSRIAEGDNYAEYGW